MTFVFDILINDGWWWPLVVQNWMVAWFHIWRLPDGLAMVPVALCRVSAAWSYNSARSNIEGKRFQKLRLLAGGSQSFHESGAWHSDARWKWVVERPFVGVQKHGSWLIIINGCLYLNYVGSHKLESEPARTRAEPKPLSLVQRWFKMVLDG